jgi:hypothetical protein
MSFVLEIVGNAGAAGIQSSCTGIAAADFLKILWAKR